MRPDNDFIRPALEALRAGAIVAYPTETFYGLAVDPENELAVAALYALKRRSRKKALSLLIPEREFLPSIVDSTPAPYQKLIHRFWPGPLTLIFKKKKNSLSFITGEDDSIALRISSHPIAAEFCRQWGRAITATSANASGEPELLTAESIAALWGDRVACILDGGMTTGAPGSTIVCCEEENKSCRIIRKGRIAARDIQQNLPDDYIICK